MTGLRTRKKAESRQRMLDVAKQLFIERGYSRTTMEEIADQAGFGVATVYNYFNTKEGIFAAMARDDMSELERQGEQRLGQLPEDPVAAVYELLLVYNQVYQFISYGVMQEFIVHAKSNGPLHEISSWALGWQKNQVTRALEQCQERGSVSETLDCEMAAEIVIDLLVRHTQRLTGSAERPPPLEHLKLALTLILHGWLTETAS
jgi:AcrR family transcriptional regulator